MKGCFNFIAAFAKMLGKGLLLIVLVVGVLVWLSQRSANSSYSAQAKNPVSQISDKELQRIIADVYHVETSRFIQPDLLWITLPSGTEIQTTCEAIANLWAHRSGLDYVRVESWNGQTRLAQATVQFGRFIKIDPIRSESLPQPDEGNVNSDPSKVDILKAQQSAQQERQEKAGELQHAYLEELVAIEGVERAEFTDLTHLKLRLKPLVHIGTEHVRVMCENVAKGWAARSGLTPVFCEEWYGEKIYAKGEYTGPVPEAYLLKVMVEVIQKQQAKDSAALVAMQGKTFAEIEGTHGAAITKSKETGWAEFRTFRARFENGKVAEVSVK